MQYPKETREVCLGDDVYEVVCRYIPPFKGIFEKGGGQISPDEPDTYEIYSIKNDGVELTGDEWNDVEEPIILKLLEEKQDAYEPEPERDEFPFEESP